MPPKSSILVLEDDDVLRELIAETLSDEGYDVTDSSTPEQALEMARLHRFQLLLTDVRMAGSTDGVGVLERLKQQRPSLKSIIITGFASQDVPVRAMKLQADDYLLKGDSGFGMRQLLTVVRRVLEQHDPSTLQRALGFIRMPLKALAESRVGVLQAARDGFFSHLYLGIRPGHLSPDLAHRFWLAAEELEKSFHNLKSPAQVTSLTQGYLALSALMFEGKSPAKVSNSELSLAEFRTLYERVRQGQLTQASLQTAGLLRTDERLRKANLQNYTLYRDIWGERGEEPPQAFGVDSRIGQLVGSYRLIEKLEAVDDVERYRALGSVNKQPHLVEIVRGPAAEQDKLDSLHHEQRDGQLYLVRAWSETARTLRTEVLPAGRAAREVVAIMRPVLELVQQAHRRQLVDGALSPPRIVLTGHGPRVPFFARLSAAELRESAQPLHWQNLPYIDPAFINGAALAVGNDQYSLGVIALELWTGLSGLGLTELLCQTSSQVDDAAAPAFDAAVRRMLGQGGARYGDLGLANDALAASVL